MAFLTCPECLKQVPNSANFCLHCGAKLTKLSSTDPKQSSVDLLNTLASLHSIQESSLKRQTELERQIGLEKETRRFKGPPIECTYCGCMLKKGAEASSEGSGCIIVILGACLTPLLIGIPIVLYGLHLMSKRDSFWICKKCGAKFPRKPKWYELG